MKGDIASIREFMKLLHEGNLNDKKVEPKTFIGAHNAGFIDISGMEPPITEKGREWVLGLTAGEVSSRKIYFSMAGRAAPPHAQHGTWSGHAVALRNASKDNKPLLHVIFGAETVKAAGFEKGAKLDIQVAEDLSELIICEAEPGKGWAMGRYSTGRGSGIIQIDAHRSVFAVPGKELLFLKEPELDVCEGLVSITHQFEKSELWKDPQ